MLPELANHTEKLLYFYEIILEGSLQATSRKLGISAATLSYNLKQLETATGAHLLTRSKSGMVPTEAGRRLHEFCRKLYLDLDGLQIQLSDLEHPQKRKIRIGSFSSIAMYFWPLLHDELQEEESLSLSISTRRSKEVLEALMNKEVDVSITAGNFKHHQLSTHEIYQDTYSFYISAKNPQRSFSVNDLREKVLLFIPDAEDEEGKTLRYHAHNFKLRFKEEFELDSFDLVGEFVKRDYGIGILPNKMARNLGKTVRRITLPGVTSFGLHRFYLSYRKDLEVKQKDLEVIIKAAHKAAKKL